MRLPCDVEIQSRMLPSQGLVKRGRSTRASLVIGRRPMSSKKEGTIFLSVCTAKDRDGVKYSLKGNVVKIFGRFVQEGKATIRIQDPAKDLCISKADPLQLKTFLTAVNLAHRDQALPEIQLSSLVPAKQAHVERPKTNVTIHRRQDYPVATGFPKTMENLMASGLGLKRIDLRILQARNLKSLDLSSNSIAAIPDALGELRQLSDLNLSHNQLKYLPVGLCKSQHLARSLKCLNLSHNTIKQLPHYLANLAGIVRLDLSHNELETLPENFGHLNRLCFLNLSHCALSYVPYSFIQLKLDEIDLSENSGVLHKQVSSRIRKGDDCNAVETLLDIVARAVILKKISHEPGDIPETLCFYLSPSRWHWCYKGHPFSVEREPNATFATPLNLDRVAHSVTVSDVQGRSRFVHMKGYLCSNKCVYKFMKYGNFK